MELKSYLRILLKKWWIICIAFLVTLTATVIFTFTQMPIYEVVVTYVVAPTDTFPNTGSFANGLEILSRRAEIATTYTEVAISSLIRKQAASRLGLTDTQQRELEISSRVRAGTNVMEIVVEGENKELVTEYAKMVGQETVAYVANLYETYRMEELDIPDAPPEEPVKPNKPLNIGLGGVFGLALGIGLAFLSAYLEAPVEDFTNFAILDTETGAYNKRYFTQRLGEEMSRAKRNEYPLTLALMNVDQLELIHSASLPKQVQNEALRKVAVFLKQYLRAEDIMARVDNTLFAFLLPDMSQIEAQALMEQLQTRIAWTAFEVEASGIKLNLSSAAGLVAYDHNGTEKEELFTKARQALQQAETTGYGKVQLFQGNGNHN
ncbi:MAG: diguanylate cyclase [Anaerolineae bacterium]|nr:diguanylate cyclase [Anaerolineae bacterium]